MAAVTNTGLLEGGTEKGLENVGHCRYSGAGVQDEGSVVSDDGHLYYNVAGLSDPRKLAWQSWPLSMDRPSVNGTGSGITDVELQCAY